MTLLLKLVRYNEMFATTIGISINLFLIYLVFTVNKSNMKQITRTLLQNSILDLLFSVSILIAEPQIVVINGIYYNVVGSPLHVYGYAFASYSISAFGGFIVLCFLAMPVPFYVRYLIICKNKAITVKKLIAIYIPIIGYSIALFLAAVWCYPPNPAAYAAFRPALMNQFWLDEYKNGPSFVATPSSDIRIITVFSMIFLATFCSYLLITILCYHIAKNLKINQFQMSKRTMLLNNQLQKTLIVQTIGPFITGNLPCLTLVIMSLFTIENHYVSLGCCSLLSWVSVINPMAALIIITPYRNRIKQILRIKNNQVSSSTNNYAVSENISKHTLPATITTKGTEATSKIRIFVVEEEQQKIVN